MSALYPSKRYLDPSSGQETVFWFDENGELRGWTDGIEEPPAEHAMAANEGWPPNESDAENCGQTLASIKADLATLSFDLPALVRAAPREVRDTILKDLLNEQQRQRR